MAEIPSKHPSLHKYIWRCDCADWHYLELEWDDEDPTWRFLELADTYWPHNFRDRLKAAWRVLRKQPHYARGILLDEPTIKDILEVLSKHVATGTK